MSTLHERLKALGPEPGEAHQYVEALAWAESAADFVSAYFDELLAATAPQPDDAPLPAVPVAYLHEVTDDDGEQSASVLAERLRVAGRALIKERTVYGEDVQTIADAIEYLSAPQARIADLEARITLALKVIARMSCPAQQLKYRADIARIRGETQEKPQ